MEHDVKIVIGANYGDEGKGLMSRYFAKQFRSDGERPITVFHNGTAQRGHTVDYEDGTRHVFHNFAAGTKEGAITYYADSFLVHPMDFCRELNELHAHGVSPTVLCDPNCVVVTPFDMMADLIIEDYIAAKTGAREYGSCCYGSWSTTDRIKERPDNAYTISELSDLDRFRYMVVAGRMMDWVRYRLSKFGVDLESVPLWKKYFTEDSVYAESLAKRFWYDLRAFIDNVNYSLFDLLWKNHKAFIFEGAQGLLLDKDRDGIWLTTSNTGIQNPVKLLAPYKDFNAEVCYVTRSYITRHGDGPLKDEVSSERLGDDLFDKTNVFNPFQGSLRYALIHMPKVLGEIEKDFSLTLDQKQFTPTLAITHCNEHDTYGGEYRSYSPCEVEKTR